MRVSVRSQLAVGVSALAASALALSPVEVSTPRSEGPVVAARVELAASVKPLVIEPMSPQQIATAHDAIARISPAAAADLQVTAAVVPAPSNAVSDWIVSGFQFIQGWVAYGVELADYVLQFIPYGYLLGDQISIVYFNLVQPISDSVVYDLIVPVVNDPLNLAAWVNGAVAVGQTVVNAAINTGIAEFNYFFGWLIPPIPPLPFAAVQVAPAETMTLKTAEVTEATEPTDATVATALDEHDTTPATATAETPEAAPKDPTPTEGSTAETLQTTDTAAQKVTPKPEAEPTKTPEPTATTTTSGGVSAQGEVRGGTSDAEDPKPAEQNTPDGTDGNDGNDTVPTAGTPTASDGAETDTTDTTKDASTARD
jgi:hypothetical protein